MQDALARSIAQTAADVLGRRSDAQGGLSVSDEAIGAHFWYERGFRDHDELVSLINHTRRALDDRGPPRSARAPYRKPIQLSFDLEAA
ncbi:hypothetical protein ABC766_32070 (plasmid) [Methylobacterium fujisawaense]|uniref:hypothetical protein n=1 Tax=Methylobacterium fujisawaense TaxID=107400 RepID=UPI0031F5B58B